MRAQCVKVFFKAIENGKGKLRIEWRSEEKKKKLIRTTLQR